jgi:hypothetical protein
VLGIIAGLIFLTLAYINPQKTGEVAGDAVASVVDKLGNALWSFLDRLCFNIGDSLSKSLNKQDWNDGKKKWIGLITVLEIVYWISRATAPRVTVTTGGVTISGQNPFGGGFSIATGRRSVSGYTLGAGRSSGRRTVRTVTERGGKVQEVVTVEEVVEEGGEDTIPLTFDEERGKDTMPIPFDEEEVRQEIISRLQATGKTIEEFTTKDAEVMAKSKPAGERKTWYDRYMYYVRSQQAQGKTKKKRNPRKRGGH